MVAHCVEILGAHVATPNQDYTNLFRLFPYRRKLFNEYPHSLILSEPLVRGKPADNKTARMFSGLFRSLDGIRRSPQGHIAECERFGDLHRRAVSDHFQLLAAISDGGYAA